MIHFCVMHVFLTNLRLDYYNNLFDLDNLHSGFYISNSNYYYLICVYRACCSIKTIEYNDKHLNKHCNKYVDNYFFEFSFVFQVSKAKPECTLRKYF